jgi:hypothetical protein
MESTVVFLSLSRGRGKHAWIDPSILDSQNKIQLAESVSKADNKAASCHKKSLHWSRSRSVSYAQAVKGLRTGYSQ